MYWANFEDDPHRLGLYRLSLDNNSGPQRVARPGTDMRYGASIVSSDVLAYRHADARLPERLVVRNAVGDEIQLSFGPKPGDPIARKGGAAETLSFKSLDGLQIPAVLYRPDDTGGPRSHAIIVHAHGGPRDKVYPLWAQ